MGFDKDRCEPLLVITPLELIKDYCELSPVKTVNLRRASARCRHFLGDLHSTVRLRLSIPMHLTMRVMVMIPHPSGRVLLPPLSNWVTKRNKRPKWTLMTPNSIVSSVFDAVADRAGDVLELIPSRHLGISVCLLSLFDSSAACDGSSPLSSSEAAHADCD